MKNKIKTSLSFICILGGTLYLVLLSWKRWPDCQTDFGEQLYLPWQLTKGKVLYKTIYYFYGPAAEYFHTFLFKHFGVSLTTLIVTNFIILFITATAIYLLFQYLNEPYGGFISLVIFLGIFAFGHYIVNGNSNYICPYSHELVYGLTLSLMGFLLIKHWLDNPRIIYLAFIGFLTGLILLTKFEIEVAFITSFLIAFGLKSLTEKSSFHIIFKRICIYSLTCLICPAAFFIFMLKYLTPHDAMKALLYPFSIIFKVGALDVHFYKLISGFDDPYRNLTLAFERVLAYLGVAFIIGLIAHWVSSFRDQKKIVLFLGFLIIIAALINIPPWTIFFCLRGLSFVLIAFLLIKLYRFIKNRSFDKNITKNILLITLAVFSVLLTLKIFLNVRVFHYGFVLAMPGTILFGYILTNQIAYLGRGRLYRPEIFQELAIFFIIGVVILHVRWSQFAYEHMNNRVGAGYDEFYGEDTNTSYRAKLINDIVNWLHQNTSPEDTLLVMPEGVMINYLARRNDPIPAYQFTPSSIALLGEDKIIDMLKKKSPSYVIFLSRDMSDHGAQAFGKDYGLNIYQWIVANYRNTLVFGELPSKLNNNTYVPHAFLMKLMDGLK